MSELIEVAGLEPQDDYDPPRYSDPGRILVEITRVASEPQPLYRYDLEVHYYDSDSSVLWVDEGVGFDFWFDEMVDLELPGFYVIEGVTGSYYRGTWGFDDDDEEWYFVLCRRATDEEVAARCLGEERSS